jgi:hypothetical protein
MRIGGRAVRGVFRFIAVAPLLAAGLLSGDAGRAAVPNAAENSAKIRAGSERAGAVAQGASGTVDAGRISYPLDRLPVLQLPDGQRRAVRSVLNISSPMAFGDYVWNDEGVAAGKAWVRVDLKRQTLSVFRGGHEIGSAVILFGADNKPTPAGVFPILAKAKQHRSSLYDAEMPFMLRLTGDGIAIHASNVFSGAVTHGCIGIPASFARLLYDQMKIGDQVAIVGL